MGQINLKKTDTPGIPTDGKAGIYVDLANSPILILSDGTEIPLGGTTLEQIYIDAITGGQSPSSENPFVTLSQLQALTGSANNVVFGGVVQWSGTGLVFSGSASGYIIENVYYEIAQNTGLTSATADPTDPRRDTFKLTASGWEVQTGTPAPTPVAPSVNVISELDRGDVLIPAGATTPTITNENVYLENTEWVTSNSGSGTFNANDTSDPFAGTKDFKATSIQPTSTMIFTRASDIDLTTYNSIGFQIKLLATMNAGRNVYVQFFNSSDIAVSSSVAIPITKTNISTYQFVAIPLNQMGFTNLTTARKVQIRYNGTGGATVYGGYLVDNVIIQSGVSGGIDSVLTQAEIDAIKGSSSPSSSNVFATMADVASGGEFDFTVSTGNPKFDIPRKYGFTTAETGNITFDGTDAKESVMIKIRHNSATAPTFSGPGGVTLRREGGTYTLSVANIIYAVCHKNDAGTLTLISYSITKAN